jgi:hypothetical protein
VVFTEDGEYHGEAVTVSDETIYVKYTDNATGNLTEMDFLVKHVRRDLEWLKSMIADRRTHSLPCFLNEGVFRSIIAFFMEQDVNPHCEKLLEEVFGILGEAIEPCVDTSGMKKRYQTLGQLVEQRAKEELQNLLEQERANLKNYIEDELDPYTQNHYLFENLSKKRNKRLQDELILTLRDGTTFTSQQVHTIVNAVFERNQAKSVDDHMAEEMEAALDAYGQVAVKRIIDNVPMLCRRIVRHSTDAIRRSFDKVTDADLARLMEDSHTFRQKFHDLEAEVAEMEKGLALFSQLS